MTVVPRMISIRRPVLLAGAAVVAALATPALAADECGGPTATGNVTCTAAGNPYATGITYATTGPLAIVVNADVAATDTVSATSRAGSAVIANRGTITTAAANHDGIDAFGLGDVTVTSNSVATSAADSAGIIASSTTGSVTVTSARSTVAAGGGVAILATGAGPVAVTSGAASATANPAILVASRNGAATVTLTGATTATQNDAVVATSGGTTRVTLFQGATVSGVNGLTLSSATGTTVSNAGAITGTNGYAIAVMLGTASVANSGTITGRVLFNGRNSTLTNSGTFTITGFSNFGAGTTRFTNTGLVGLSATAPTSGLDFLGLAAFDNSGTISLANGRSGDVLTLPGAFTASGISTLVLDTGALRTDRLAIGGVATGVTTVRLVVADGALLDVGSTIATVGAGSSAGAFVLDPAAASAGFIRRGLAFDATNNAYVLIATPSAEAYRPLKYVEGARNVAYRTADVWAARMRLLRDAPAATGRLWGQFYGAIDSRRTTQASTVFGVTAIDSLSNRQDYYGGQLGFDIGRIGEKGGVAFGVTGGYQNSKLNFYGSAAGARYSTANGGAYVSFVGGPLFVNVLGKYDHYAIRARSPAIGFSDNFRGYSYGVRGEAGVRAGKGGFYVEPLVSIDWVRTHLDSISAFDSRFDFGTNTGLRGKAGARIGSAMPLAGGPVLTLYAGGNAVKEFRGRGGLAFTNNTTTLDFRNRRIGLYGEGYGGVQVLSGSVSGFIEGFGDVGAADTQRGGGGRAGLRIAL